MNSFCSNSTITTTGSLNCSISSKNMLRNSSHLKNSSHHRHPRNAKYKVRGPVATNRWRAPARRDSSLTQLMKINRHTARSNTSMTSNLGRGFEGMRLGSNHSTGEFKDAPIAEIRFNSEPKALLTPICIKNVALNRALHRDIDLKMMNDVVGDPSSLSQERWSARSSGEKKSEGLSKPKRCESGDLST